MMCKTCNVELTDFEATRKDANTYQFLDMCNICIAAARINTIDRVDLISEGDLDGFDVDTFDFDSDSWK